MGTLSWADTHICAAHMGDGGTLHGHTWKVRAHWPYQRMSIVHLKAGLEEACKQFDHETLPNQLRRAEDLAERIGLDVGAVRVDVWREPEGMGATWTP